LTSQVPAHNHHLHAIANAINTYLRKLSVAIFGAMNSGDSCCSSWTVDSGDRGAILLEHVGLRVTWSTWQHSAAVRFQEHVPVIATIDLYVRLNEKEKKNRDTENIISTSVGKTRYFKHRKYKIICE